MYRNELLLTGKAYKNATQSSVNAPWKFTLTQGGGKKKDSDERWPVCFYNVICWPAKCDGPAAEVKSGDFVEITGRLQQRSYEQDGAKRSTVEIVAATIIIHPKQQKPITPKYETPALPKHEQKVAPARPVTPEDEITDDDIPF